ncbi:MAG TPA: hypothetical protein VKZ50_08395 [bacterium]|nr:hypothetical protein [bacterium]
MWPQPLVAPWDVLRRAAAANDRPSTGAERARSPLAADPGRVVYRVRPRETDPQIVRFLRDHDVVYDRTVPQNGKLFVFLPGTWGRPVAYQRILDEAARAGYKAIGLEYADDTLDPKASAVGQICLRNPNPGCSARVRTVRILGGAADGVIVAPADGLQNRLEKLLAYLAQEHPADGWDRFLLNGRVAWDLVAIGGHSQGAGMAAFLAKTHTVARVVLWSGPADYVVATHSMAPWLSAPSATPSDRWYGVVHRDEAGAAALLAAYTTLGIPGTPVVADGPIPPRGTHQFVVTLPPRLNPAAPVLPAIANAYHGSVAADARTPIDAAGRPVYARLWRTMVGP